MCGGDHNVTLVDLDPHNNWALDLALLASQIRSNTAMIVCNFPHNPTGAVLPHAVFHQLVALAQQHDLWIFFDEVYRGLEVRPETQLPSMCTSYAKSVSLGVVSKSLGLAGLRIGWLAMQDTEALASIANTKHYLSICNSAPSEVLALIAIRNKDVILHRNNELVRRNLALIDAFMAKYSAIFDWTPAVGGCTGFVHFKGLPCRPELSLDDFADICVKQYGVLILPGSKFPTSGNGAWDVKTYFRFGFGRDNFPEGLEQFEIAIQSIRGKA